MEKKKSQSNFVMYLGVIIVCLFIGMIFFWINKSTYSVSDNSLNISCRAVVVPAEEFSCDIMANLNIITAKTINFNYELPEGITYVNFGLSDNGFEIYANTPLGVAIVNENGLTGSFKIGTLTLKAEEDITNEGDLTFKLKNIEVVDSLVKLHTLDEAVTSFRLANNVNTLKEIVLSNNLKLNPEFDPLVLEYNVDVSSKVDKVTIIANPTFEGAMVSGNINKEMDLNYGINTFTIKVIPESNNLQLENTYTIKINRAYEFNSSKYIYNKELNYLYTRNDTTKEQIISSLETLPEGMRYDIRDNKLIIENDNGVMNEIGIINFKLDNHIEDKKVYIESGTTYDDLINSITLNGVKVVITNSDDTVIDSSEIKNTYKFKVYDMKSNLLETYGFDMNYLNFDDDLIIDKDKGIIKRILVGTKYSELVSKIKTSGKISIISQVGETLTMDDIVKTNDKIKIEVGGTEHIYSISVLGDLTGDGKIEINDVSRLFRYYMGRINLDDVSASAGEIINDGVLEINDISRLFRYYMGRITSL